MAYFIISFKKIGLTRAGFVSFSFEPKVIAGPFVARGPHLGQAYTISYVVGI